MRIVRLVRSFSGTLSAHSALSAQLFRRPLVRIVRLVRSFSARVREVIC
jgi:hypothetical protein